MMNRSLSILTPMYGGQVSFNYLDSFLGLAAACAREKIGIEWRYLWSDSLVPRARNHLVDQFLKQSRCTHALLIDADIGFDPAGVIQMLDRDYDVTAAPYPKKKIRWDRVGKAVLFGGAFKPGQLPKMPSPDDLARICSGEPPGEVADPCAAHSLSEPWEMRTAGTGLMLVKRETFERVREKFRDRWYQPKWDVIGTHPETGLPIVGAAPQPIWDFFPCGVNLETREYDSEDYGFCNLVRQAGMKIMLLPWVRTSHWGNHLYLGDLPAVARLVGDLT